MKGVGGCDINDPLGIEAVLVQGELNIWCDRSEPQFGHVEEGINFLLVVAWPRPATGSREPRVLPTAGPGTEIALGVDVIPYQRGLPDPKKRVTQLFPEGVHLRRRAPFP